MSLIQDFWADVGRLRQQVVSAPVQRNMARMVPKERVRQDNDPFPNLIAGDKFKAGANYFGIRLAGIHLVQARKFAERILPLCVCMVEFGQSREERTVPFSVGPSTIRQRLKAQDISDAAGAEQAWIELKDLTVLRPTPVGSGNLSLFVGLYAVPGDDIVKTLLNVLGDLGGAFGTTGLAPAVETAKTIYSGFGALLGLNNVQPKIEALNGRALPGTGSGYMLVARAPEDTLEARDLVVDRGTLRDKAGKLVTDFDYCLVAIEHYPSIIEEGTGIAPDIFGDAAAAVQNAVSDEDPDRYKRELSRLIRTIQASTEVIEADKDQLVSAYVSLFEKRAKQASSSLPNRGDGSASRGSGYSVALAIDSQKSQVSDSKPALADALHAIYDFVDQGDGAKLGKEPTRDELWAAVRQDARAIGTKIEALPPAGEIAAAIARALESFQASE